MGCTGSGIHYWMYPSFCACDWFAIDRLGGAKGTQIAESVCVEFADWIGGRTISNIGTDSGATTLPFQRWRRFKEAFAPELVERAISETFGSVRHVVDPFGGSGTTSLAAQFLGKEPTTIEVNPFLADLIEAKVAPIDWPLATDMFAQVVDYVTKEHGPKDPVICGAPRTFVEPGVDGRYIFSRDVARRFLTYRAAIDRVGDPVSRRLFRVILASSAVPASNVVVSGKGRRYRGGWQKRGKRPEIVDELFRDGVSQALNDLRKFANRRCLEYRVLRGDARELADRVGRYDLAVFSPPYPNSFDYTDVYNVELWATGYLSGRETNTRLRRSTIRSHVQLLPSFEDEPIESVTLKKTIEALRDVRGELWNQHIPEMIGAYAKDIEVVMKKLAMGLRPRGRVYIVVGNSRYAGVEIPVAKIITEIVHLAGYSVVLLEPCRSMRSSPQQGGRNDLRENLVVLQKR